MYVCMHTVLTRGKLRQVTKCYIQIQNLPPLLSSSGIRHGAVRCWISFRLSQSLWVPIVYYPYLNILKYPVQKRKTEACKWNKCEYRWRESCHCIKGNFLSSRVHCAISLFSFCTCIMHVGLLGKPFGFPYHNFKI